MIKWNESTKNYIKTTTKQTVSKQWLCIMGYINNSLSQIIKYNDMETLFITVPLWEESTSHWWSSFTMGQIWWAFMFSLLSASTSCWMNNGDVDDLGCLNAHVTLLWYFFQWIILQLLLSNEGFISCMVSDRCMVGKLSLLQDLDCQWED